MSIRAKSTRSFDLGKSNIRTEIAKVMRLEDRYLTETLLLNENLRRKSTTDTTKIIREWRERRYGESGS